MGIGGQLMWTPLAKELYEKHNKKVVFYNSGGIIRDNIWINNPYISFIKTPETISINLQKYNRHFRKEMGLEQHGVLTRCLFYNITPKSLYPILKYTNKEEEKIKKLLRFLPKKFLCIEPHSKTSYTQNKSFSFRKWQNVVNELIKHNITIVQVSIPSRPLLDNVIDFRRRLSSFRECACLLKHCSLFISTEGGLMHASVANQNRSFILYSPMFHPKYTLYDIVEHLWVHTDEHQACIKVKPCRNCINQMKNYDENKIIKKILEIY